MASSKDGSQCSSSKVGIIIEITVSFSEGLRFYLGRAKIKVLGEHRMKSSLSIYLMLALLIASVETAAKAQRATPEIRFPDENQVNESTRSYGSTAIDRGTIGVGRSASRDWTPQTRELG